MIIQSSRELSVIKMKYLLISVLAAFSVSILLMLLLLPLLKKIKAGQYILSYVKEHKNKAGTPTMGGLAFIGAIIICSLLFYGIYDRDVIFILTIVFAFMVVGFLDDFLKIYKKQNEGLKAYQKIIFQGVIALLAGAYAYFNGKTLFLIPLTKITFNAQIFTLPLVAFVFIATVNCVNLTDGLDGLAGQTFLSYSYIMGTINYLKNDDLYLLSFISCGAIAAFLLFNTNKASVFMGDTGSLALGSIVACTSLFSGNGLYIPLLGIMFVLSGITVIIQVIYYKRTGKRIFLMSPVHHHFQMLGYSESKISYAYQTITIIIGLILILFV